MQPEMPSPCSKNAGKGDSYLTSGEGSPQGMGFHALGAHPPGLSGSASQRALGKGLERPRAATGL